jgi:ketosteroid isomerase-like protein
MTATSDRVAIERVHNDWWAANRDLDVEGMTRDLAEDFLMWNLNGHPYFNRAEVNLLVHHYREDLPPTEPPELWDIRITAGTDLAYVTAEGVLPIWDAVRFRETMVLRREPGTEHGWRICHFHCSPLAPADERRPAFDDSGATRGRRGETITMVDTSS